MDDRQCTKVRPPPARPLSSDKVFTADGVDLEILKAYLIENGSVSKELMMRLVTKAREIFVSEANVVKVDGDVVIIGDIHGQFMDMMGMFHKLKKQPGKNNTKFLFLGDYVDRGEFGVEVMIYLLALKLAYPTDVTLLRGNHETEEMTSSFNFRTQVLDRFDIETYAEMIELFQSLPIAAITNGKLLCLHGGISQRVTNIKAINSVDRFREPPENGVLADVLWADPFDKAKDAQTNDYIANKTRNISVVFGLKPAKALLKAEKMLAIVRAHQVKPEGYEFHNWEGNFPTVITIFSAPNYEQMENNGAVLISTASGAFDVRTFQENEEQQSIYEDNQDMISLMQPRLSQLIFQMFTNILEYGASQFTPGVVKSLSTKQNIDWNYLKKVTEASKGEEKQEKKKIGVNINFKKKPAKGKPGEKAASKEKEEVKGEIKDLKVEGYSDEENEDDDIETAQQI